MLHDIRDDYNNRYAKRYELPYFLSNERFISGLRSLNKGNGLVVLDNAVDDYFDVQQSRDLLTFDDGLKDHLAVARILYKLEIAAVFFVPSGILNGAFVDSHKIQFILSVLSEEKILSIIKNCLKVSDNQWRTIYREYSTSLWNNNIWSDGMVFITRFFRSFNDIDVRRSILDRIFDDYIFKHDPDLHNQFYLSKEDITEIVQMGHQIGGHGVKSYNLEFETLATISDELKGSREFLLNLGMPLRFALANGGYNDEVLRIAEELNFKKCYTTNNNYETRKYNILDGREDFTKSY